MIIDSGVVNVATVMVFRVQAAPLLDVDGGETASGNYAHSDKTYQLSKDEVECNVTNKSRDECTGGIVDEFSTDAHKFKRFLKSFVYWVTDIFF